MRVSERRYQNGTLTTAFGYDFRGRANAMTHSNGSGVFDDRAYTWDAGHNKTHREASDASGFVRSTTYTYDGLNRMDTASLAVGGAAPVVTDYNHDGAGNRTDVGGAQYTLAAGLGATVHEYGTTPHESFTRAYDANGNYTGDEASAVVGIGYNADNLMIWYVDDSGVDEAYRYDASNRRVRIERNGAVDRYFLYLGDRILEEYTGTGTLARSYVYEVLQRRDEVTGETYYYFSDDQWNVVALTDTAGSVVERYTYDDFGAPTVTDAAWAPVTGNTSAVGNTRLFQGRDYDSATALYHYRARYYDPATGRFTTRDPLGIWGDVLHLGNGYSFLNNNPWSLVDPFGLKAGSNKIDWWGEVFSPMLVGRDLLEFGKGFFIDGLGGTVIGAANLLRNPLAFIGGIREFAAALYDDPKAILGSMYNDFVDSLDDPRAIGMYTAGAMMSVVGGAGIVKLMKWLDDVAPQVRVIGNGQVLDKNGRLRNADGTFAYDGGRKPGELSDSGHGNSRNSDRPATLYELYDGDGNFQKWGVSQDPDGRYSKAEIGEGYTIRRLTGDRSTMLDHERYLTERFPGPLNNEHWAGSKVIDADG